MSEPFPLSPALWAATALPAPPTPPLRESTRADVAIVGGGYLGLSAALHLAEQGADVALIEAREPGWGASGRNGGQVIPGLKYDPDELVAKFGESAGEALTAFAGGTADFAFDLIDRLRLDVPSQRTGWIQGAHSAEGLNLADRRVAQWGRRGAPVERLDRDAVAALVGSRTYLGGWIDRRGGAVQPLALAREIARAATASGARIHGQTRAVRLEPQGARWKVHAAGGASIDAARVLLATNGYTDGLVPGLKQSIVAVNSFQVATQPLGDNLRRTILPQGQVVSDTRKLLLYFRLDAEGRLLMGGRGRLGEPTRAADWAHLERVLKKVFPQAADAAMAFRWGGRVAATRDSLPHLHEPAPGLLVDIGCMGRGIGLQTSLGARMARYIGSGRAADLPFPITPVRGIPFHALNKLYLAAIIAWHRATDSGVK